jgi:hypothetical protein
MKRRQTVDLPHPLRCQAQSDDAVIVEVALTADESGGLGAIHETDGAVVSQEKVFGDVPDRRPSRIGMPSHDEEQLMLRRRQADRTGLLFTPAQKTTKGGAKREQCCVLIVGELAPRSDCRSWGR